MNQSVKCMIYFNIFLLLKTEKQQYINKDGNIEAPQFLAPPNKYTKCTAKRKTIPCKEKPRN